MKRQRIESDLKAWRMAQRVQRKGQKITHFKKWGGGYNFYFESKVINSTPFLVFILFVGLCVLLSWGKMGGSDGWKKALKESASLIVTKEGWQRR